MHFQARKRSEIWIFQARKRPALSLIYSPNFLKVHLQPRAVHLKVPCLFTTKQDLPSLVLISHFWWLAIAIARQIPLANLSVHPESKIMLRSQNFMVVLTHFNQFNEVVKNNSRCKNTNFLFNISSLTLDNIHFLAWCFVNLLSSANKAH